MVPVEQRCTVHAGKERETVRDVGADVLLGGTLREELLDTGMGRAQLIAQREEELVELLVRVAVRVDDDRWDPGIADLELVELAQAEAHLVGRVDRGPVRRRDLPFHGRSDQPADAREAIPLGCVKRQVDVCRTVPVAREPVVG